MGRTCDNAWERVKEADEYYRRECGRWLTIIEAGRTDTIKTIRSVALAAKHKAGGDKPVLIVLDYLQILPPPEGEGLEGVQDKVDRNMSELRRLSRDLKSPVLVISSEDREAYKPGRGEVRGAQAHADRVAGVGRDRVFR